MFRWKFLVLLCAFSVPLLAQDSELEQDSEYEATLADIRQDLSYLFVEIQRLKRELSTTSSPSGLRSDDSIVLRVDAIQAQLERLVDATERLEFKVQNVIEDGTARIADLEFRLVELEGGDLEQLSETTTLGKMNDSEAPKIVETETIELAVGEEADFDTAQKAMDDLRYEEAAEMFSRFGKTYPNSPLAPKAFLMRGKALEANEDTKGAARAYLESFTNYQNSAVAPEALTFLGKALVKLGRIEAGCQTLSQVEIRFPETPFAEDANKAMQLLECL